MVKRDWTLSRAGCMDSAGLFAGGCNGMSAIIAGSTDIALYKCWCSRCIYFSSYNFIADAIINKFDGIMKIKINTIPN